MSASGCLGGRHLGGDVWGAEVWILAAGIPAPAGPDLGLGDLTAGGLDAGIWEAGTGRVWGSSGGSPLGKEPRNTKLDGRLPHGSCRDVRGRLVVVPVTCPRGGVGEGFS